MVTQTQTYAADVEGNNDFFRLRQIIKSEGLLEKQLIYYTFKIIATLGLLAAGLAFLILVDNFWLRLLDAAFLALVYAQIGYVGHDAGHQAVTRSARGNEIIGLGVNFLISLSRSWWITQHSQHHDTPNDLEKDPHTMLPVMAFSTEQALAKRGLLRVLVRYQAFYFWPLLLLEGLGIRLAGAQFLLRGQNVRYRILEPLLMALHFVVYFGLLFYLMSPLQVLAFTVVHQGLFGLHYGLVFAPNHKGMLIIEENNKLDYLRMQVLTTRNVRPSRWASFWYGGLNFQIEHHLFPTMSRNQLGVARKLVKAFCAEHDITYYETGTWRSLREIAASLHQASAPLRR
jgi:fatty acid desaturase